MSRATVCVLALAIAALTGCGGDKNSSAAEPNDLFRALPRETTVAPADKAAPRWEPLAILRGRGDQTRSVVVSRAAIQWRARWLCQETGRLALSISPRPRSGPTGTAGDCPGSGRQSWVTAGAQRLRVLAPGGWRVEVEQEVDSALHEAPTAAMRSAKAHVLARGTFSKIERKGRGSATLYRLPGGRLALRMANFATDANTDLFVWLSEARRPRTTRAAFQARHREVALLKSTLGDQNYVLPRGIDASLIRSVVIWCAPVQIAYTAATLTR
ncbi:MAG: hypothetical protein QOJ89_4429 [bacterium]